MLRSEDGKDREAVFSSSGRTADFSLLGFYPCKIHFRFLISGTLKS